MKLLHNMKIQLRNNDCRGITVFSKILKTSNHVSCS